MKNLNKKQASIKMLKGFKLMGLMVLGTVISACGGGSSGDSNSNANAATVSSTSPSDNASNVARNSNISATFNQDILSTSVDTTSFTLAKSGTSSLSGSVSFDGANNIANFTPDSPLALLTTYTASLSTAITDLSGNALASNFNWSFITADGTWGSAVPIENNTGDTRDPQIVIDTNDNALAVWTQADGSGNNSIWANRFDGTSWGSAVVIDANISSSSHALEPQIAIDNNGNALAVWQQSDGGQTNIWANRFDGTVWMGAELIEADNGFASVPKITIDNNGNALAVWQQFDGTVTNIWANHFDGTNWSTAEKIESNDTGDASDPQIAFDSNGRARAVWSQNNGSVSNIWTNRFNDTSWDSAGMIENSTTGDASDPQIDFDANNNALVVWSKDDGTRDNIWAIRFNSSGSLGTAELIETENLGNAFDPQITFDNAGNALAVWGQSDGSLLNIWANYFDGTNWLVAERIEADDINEGISPQIAFDSTGNALAVWQHFDDDNFGHYDIWANRFNGTSWGSAGLIETNDAGGAFVPQIAIDSKGNALAVWKQNDGSNNNIVVNRFE